MSSSSYDRKFQRVKQSLREGDNYAQTNQLILAFQCYNHCLEQIQKLEHKSGSKDGTAEDLTFLKAVVLNSMGIAHIKQADLNSALSCFKMSLNIKTTEIYGVKTHPHLAGAYYNLGRVYHYHDQLGDAIKFYHLALNSRESSSSSAHANHAGNNSTSPNELSDYNSNNHHHNTVVADEQSIPIVLQLGIAYMDDNQLPEAKKYFEQALRVGRKTLGANDPAVANLLTYMGKIHVMQENYHEALKMYKDALKICFNGSIGGTPMKVLKELVRTTEIRAGGAAQLASSNYNNNHYSNSNSSNKNLANHYSDMHLVTRVRDFLVELVCDESQSLSAFLTTNQTMEKRLRRLLELQVVFTDQFAGTFKVLGSESGGEEPLSITKLLQSLVSFFHDRLVIHRAHIKRLENATAQVFDVQKQLFSQLECKLQAYMDLHDSMPSLVEILNTVAMGYRDHERMFLSHTKMMRHHHNHHDNDNGGANSAIREKLVMVIHGILKTQATRLETEVSNLGTDAETGRRGLPLLYAPDDLSAAGGNSVAQSHASHQNNGGGTTTRPQSSQSTKGGSTRSTQNGSLAFISQQNSGSRKLSQSHSQSQASIGRSRSRNSRTPQTQDMSYASADGNGNGNESRSRSSSRYGGSRKENSNRIYQDNSGSWGVTA